MGFYEETLFYWGGTPDGKGMKKMNPVERRRNTRGESY